VKSSTWQLQEAKNRFSEVVELARTKGAQTITKHGKPVAVVVEIGAYRSLDPAKKPRKKRGLIEHLRACPEPGIFKFIDESRLKPDYGRTIDLG
jgi:prevent-host-death family protein